MSMTSQPLALCQRLQPNLSEVAHRSKKQRLGFRKFAVDLQFESEPPHGTDEIGHLEDS